MTRVFPILPLAAVLALGSLTLASCHKPPPKTTDAEQARAVRIVMLEPRSITGTLTASGDLISREEATVLPQVAGYRVSRVLADVGDTVKKGQTLAELDPSLIQAQIAQQQALADQAKAQADQADAQASRVNGLDDQGVLAQESIDQRRFQARAARATANAQAAALKDIKTRAATFAVSAPVSGLILERNVKPGDLSSLAGTAWFRMARDGEIELQAQMSEDDIAKIKTGQAAQVFLPDGSVVTGTVRLISPQIDPQTKLGAVRVHLPVRPDIRAGGFARAVFNGGSGVVLAVPETAVRYDADGASVVVVGANNRVRRAPITTGQHGGGYVQLIKGPPAGVWIVQNAAAFLLDGDMVRPIRGADAAPAAAPARAPARR